MTDAVRARRRETDIHTLGFAARGPWISFGTVSLVTALCAWLGYVNMFKAFGYWDDEGYMLIALKAFAHHGGLYTHVSTQYGPFYFESLWPIFSWLPVTHDSGRIATLVAALLTSLGVGAALRMFTRSALAGILAQVGGFLLLLSFATESMHPSVLVCLLFAVALIALALIARERRVAGSTMLGAAVGAIALTQVNAGAFACLAMLFTALVLGPRTQGMRIARVFGSALFIATPFLLLAVAAGNDDSHWALRFGLVVAFAAAGVFVVTHDTALHGLVRARDVSWFLLGGGVLGAVVVAIALLSGTGPLDLVQGVLIHPANQSDVFTIPLYLPPGVEIWAAACFAGSCWYRWYRRRNPPNIKMVASAQLFVGLLILFCALVQAEIRSSLVASSSFTYALPLLFVVAIPRHGATEGERVARVALVSLAVLEGLLAYPVAGAQVRWASLLIVPAGVLCLHDGIREVRPFAEGRWRQWGAARFGSVAVVIGLCWLTWVFLVDLTGGVSTYYRNPASTLPGSGRMHLADRQSEPLESLSRAIHEDCSTFLTLPGMNSLYFWAEKEPPSSFNTNSWFYLLDASEQAHVVRRVERLDASRFCVVDSPRVLFFWTHNRPLPNRPLVRFIQKFEREATSIRHFGYYRLFMAGAKT